MYNHGAVWVYDHPSAGHAFPYEPSDLGDYPLTHPPRFSDHIDHHRFLPAPPYSYDPYAQPYHWYQHPQFLPPHSDAYHHNVDSRMPRGEVAVPSARRHASDAYPDGRHRAPSSPTLPPITRSPSHSASDIDRSTTSSIPPTTTSPSPHPTASPRVPTAHHGPYAEDGSVSYTYPPPRPRDSQSSSGYSYHSNAHPAHRYSPYNPPSAFGGTTSPPPATVASQASASHHRPLYVHPPPQPGPPSEIIHTDDAATKLSDRVRRRCFNCCTTETSTWRRSSLNPGKVLCNKCGLFERTHSRPRPEQFPHKRGPVPAAQRSKGTVPPPFGPLPPQPSSPSTVPSVAPHHYDHPSLAPLRSRAESQKSPHMDSLPAIKSLLQSPNQAPRVPSPPRPESKRTSLPSPSYQTLATDGQSNSSSLPKHRSKYTSRRSRSPTRHAT